MPIFPTRIRKKLLILAVLTLLTMNVTNVGRLKLEFSIPTVYAATYDVSNLNDSGAGSLRQAINDANANPGNDLISFSVAGTITLVTNLPGLAEGVTLDATTTTQAGANIVVTAPGAGNALGLNGGSGYVIKGMGFRSGNTCLDIGSLTLTTDVTIGGTGSEDAVYVDGCTLNGIGVNNSASDVTIINTLIGTVSPSRDGISVFGNSSNVTIGGTTSSEKVVSVNNTRFGIRVDSATNVTITGSHIGVDSTGLVDQGNATAGIQILTNSSGITIGGSTAGERNVISGNAGFGIRVSSGTATIKGNYIGLNATGTAALANDTGGISLLTSSNVVGGDTASEGNVISGNGSFGVQVSSASVAVASNRISNNIIGLNAAGTSAVANTGPGINFTGANGATATTIGGAGMGNVISGNTSHGINIAGSADTGTLIRGNLIGLSSDGTTALGNGGSGIVVASSGNFIGEAGVSGSSNTIAANGATGITLSAGTNTVAGNVIGKNTAGTSAGFSNTSYGVLINGGASSVVGDGTSNGENQIFSDTTPVYIDTTAGNFNKVRRNSYPTAAALLISRNGTSNESVATPVVTSVIRNNPTELEVDGTAIVSATIDLYQDGIWLGSTSSDGAGAYSATLTSSSDSDVIPVATKSTSSTSQSGTQTPVVPDTTPPDAPVLDYDTPVPAPDTVTITGTGEIGASVYVDGVDSGIVVDGLGSFSVDVGILAGTNEFSFTLVDAMSNVSDPTVATITGTTSSHGGAPHAGSAHEETTPSTPDSTDEETPTESPTTETDSSEESPLAGDDEVQTEPDEVTEEVVPDVVDDADVVSNPEPIKTHTGNPVYNQYELNSHLEELEEVDPVDTEESLDSTSEEQDLYTLLATNPSLKIKYLVKLLNSQTFGDFYLSSILPKNLVNTRVSQLETENQDGSVEVLDLNGDRDQDRVKNSTEILFGGDMGEADTDKDGLSDYEEIFETHTDPEWFDTDRDGQSDKLDLAPLVYADLMAGQTFTQEEKTMDTDDDGLVDGVERLLKTDPTTKDTDDDEISDSSEYLFFGTDPLTPNTYYQNSLLQMSNIRDGQLLPQNFVVLGHGQADSLIGIYEVLVDGQLKPISEGWTDQDGKFAIQIDKTLSNGSYFLVAVDKKMGDKKLNELEFTDISRTVKVRVASNDLSLSESQTNTLETSGTGFVNVLWRSTLYGQVLIADASMSNLSLTPPKELEAGEHTVIWFADNGSVVSEPGGKTLTIAKTETKDWTSWIVVTSVCVIGVASTLAIRKRKRS